MVGFLLVDFVLVGLICGLYLLDLIVVLMLCFFLVAWVRFGFVCC